MGNKKKGTRGASGQTVTLPAPQDTPPPKPKTSYTADTLERFHQLAAKFGSLPNDAFYSAFTRAGRAMANQASIQNQRVKTISPLPADYSKAELGEFLTAPQSSEKQLQQISQALRFTVYPYFKITKLYADILTYRHFTIPQYLEKDSAKSDEFWREFRLVDKIEKAVKVEQLGHQANGQSNIFGKSFYILRHNIDRSHNKVKYMFYQQLPQEWCKIIGFNNITKYTISFNLMYFLQPGTDWRQYGDLFEPYMEDFDAIFQKKKDEKKSRAFVYASECQKIGGQPTDGATELSDRTCNIEVGNRKYCLHIDNVNSSGAGNPKMFMQNGRWAYDVTLPIDRVWTFEIDDTTPIIAPPMSGLMQSFTQQADFEAAQLSIVVNPLVKIFTGEIPYRSQNDGASEEDAFSLSLDSRKLFEIYWNMLMANSNTGGTAFFTAPVQNIKSHDYAEAANANDISSSFNSYVMEKAGLTALIPANENPHQGISQYSAKLEAQFPICIYRTLENMVNHLFESLNLEYEWHFQMFGDIYAEATMRADAMKQLNIGDLSAWFVLAALDGQSILDKLSMSRAVKESGLLDYLIPPKTSYTQSANDQSATPKQTGAPQKTEQEVEETKVQKQSEGESTDGNE